MPGKYTVKWCWVCHKPAGIDCPTRSLSKKQVRLRLKRLLIRDPGSA